MPAAAKDVPGFTISQSFHVMLRAPKNGIKLTNDEDTAAFDVAHAIGVGLMEEAMKVLQMAAESEGFTVDIKFGQLVY